MTNKIKVDPSCMDDFDKESILPAEALQRIFNLIKAVSEKVNVPVREALGKVLAENITSSINVPSGRNSAMDGYAIRSKDLPEDGVKTFNMIGTCLAGKPFKQAVDKDQCVRIMTGAIMPRRHRYSYHSGTCRSKWK